MPNVSSTLYHVDEFAKSKRSEHVHVFQTLSIGYQNVSIEIWIRTLKLINKIEFP